MRLGVGARVGQKETGNEALPTVGSVELSAEGFLGPSQSGFHCLCRLHPGARAPHSDLLLCGLNLSL